MKSETRYKYKETIKSVETHDTIKNIFPTAVEF